MKKLYVPPRKIGIKPLRESDLPTRPEVPKINLESVSVRDIVESDLFKYHARCEIIARLHVRQEWSKRGQLKRQPIDHIQEAMIIGYCGDNQIENFCEAFILWYDRRLNMPRAQREFIGELGMLAYNRTCVDIGKTIPDDET